MKRAFDDDTGRPIYNYQLHFDSDSHANPKHAITSPFSESLATRKERGIASFNRPHIHFDDPIHMNSIQVNSMEVPITWNNVDEGVIRIYYDYKNDKSEVYDYKLPAGFYTMNTIQTPGEFSLLASLNDPNFKDSNDIVPFNTIMTVSVNDVGELSFTPIGVIDINDDPIIIMFSADLTHLLHSPERTLADDTTIPTKYSEIMTGQVAIYADSSIYRPVLAGEKKGEVAERNRSLNGSTWDPYYFQVAVFPKYLYLRSDLGRSTTTTTHRTSRPSRETRNVVAKIQLPRSLITFGEHYMWNNNLDVNNLTVFETHSVPINDLDLYLTFPWSTKPVDFNGFSFSGTVVINGQSTST